jgi:hypothetical protein
MHPDRQSHFARTYALLSVFEHKAPLFFVFSVYVCVNIRVSKLRFSLSLSLSFFFNENFRIAETHIKQNKKFKSNRGGNKRRSDTIARYFEIRVSQCCLAGSKAMFVA